MLDVLYQKPGTDLFKGWTAAEKEANLAAIDAALAPSALTGLQTLGGLVSHCWIEGKLMKDAGDLDGDFAHRA